MAVTLRQISKQTGLSIQTVGHVLNNAGGKRGSYRPETQQIVLNAAAQLGYRPNLAARATASGKFGAVALLLSTVKERSTLPEGLFRGVCDALAEQDLNLMTSRLPDSKLISGGFVPKILRHSLSDGLLINYTDHIPPEMTDLIRSHGIPAVWINSKHPADCVYPDDFAAGQQAAEHLLRLGHRKTAFVDYAVSGHYSIADRRDGYLAAMRQAGLTPSVVHAPHGLLSPRQRIELTTQWMGAMPVAERPTGILVNGMTTAQPVGFALMQMGLRIPQDVSLISFDGRTPDLMGLPLTHMVLPEEAVGRVAVAMLLKKIKAPTEPFEPVAVPLDFNEGESLAVAP